MSTIPPRFPEGDSPANRRLMDATLALILAGGKGTRLGALTAQRAKPAMPIAIGLLVHGAGMFLCFSSR